MTEQHQDSSTRTTTQSVLSPPQPGMALSPCSQNVPGRSTVSQVSGKNFLQYGIFGSIWTYKNILLSEVGNLLPRIRHRMSKTVDGCGVDLGKVYRMQANGLLELDTRTQARIRGTQYVLSNRAWATLVELEIFLEGWDAGARWPNAEDY